MRRFLRGCTSLIGVVVHPLAPLFRCGVAKLRTIERQQQGLVVVLPGIEGESFLNHSIAWGLADAGVPFAIELFDWTTGCILCFLYHLRGARRHRVQAEKVAARIVEYQRDFSGRPVFLIGHSGGGGIALYALEKLPPSHKITAAILLAPAVSPDFDVSQVLKQTDRGIWDFRPCLDLFLLRLGTLFAGTMDGVHTFAAGAVGFRRQVHEPDIHQPALVDFPYRFSMARCFNFGGHMGSTNRVFVSEWIAPLLKVPAVDDKMPGRLRRMGG